MSERGEFRRELRGELGENLGVLGEYTEILEFGENREFKEI